MGKASKTVARLNPRWLKPVETDFLIIGGGLTGLMCALHLHRHRKDYILVEAAGRVGGRVWTDFQDGFF